MLQLDIKNIWNTAVSMQYYLGDVSFCYIAVPEANDLMFIVIIIECYTAVSGGVRKYG